MTYHGQIKNGTIVLNDPVELPEGAEVDVAIRPATQTARTFYDRFADLIGSCPDLPSDMAECHDHYLHGRAKK